MINSVEKFHEQFKIFRIQIYLLEINLWIMTPGIGLMSRRLKTEKDATSLAISGIIKNYNIKSDDVKILEPKYDDDAADWYVALGWNDERAIIKMDSVLGTITEIKEI